MISPTNWCLIATLTILASVGQADDLQRQTLDVPQWNQAIAIDGMLDEACYSRHMPLTHFVDAADPKAMVAATKAWVFWSEEQLIFAFQCEDRTPAAAEPTGRENDVDPQDRVELFLWSGRNSDPYYCIEIAAKGAVHDYQARFYRQFDNSWTPKDLVFRVHETKEAYTVEASLAKQALSEIGFSLKQDQSFRAGLFRADYDRLNGQPTWITWVNSRTKEPDFHVAEAFGTFRLIP